MSFNAFKILNIYLNLYKKFTFCIKTFFLHKKESFSTTFFTYYNTLLQFMNKKSLNINFLTIKLIFEINKNM